jgi:hypothetical protein
MQVHIGEIEIEEYPDKKNVRNSNVVNSSDRLLPVVVVNARIMLGMEIAAVRHKRYDLLDMAMYRIYKTRVQAIHNTHLGNLLQDVLTAPSGTFEPCAGFHKSLAQQNATFSNPIIYSDYSGNSVSVGPDGAFYFSASNVHYSPGAPILRSRGLIN